MAENQGLLLVDAPLSLGTSWVFRSCSPEVPSPTSGEEGPRGSNRPFPALPELPLQLPIQGRDQWLGL